MRTFTTLGGTFLLALLPTLTGAQEKLSVPPPETTSSTQNIAITQLLDTAHASLQRGDMASAAVALEKALSLDKRQKKARVALINVFMRQGRLAEAEQHAQTLGQLFPDETESIFYLALIAFQRGQPAESSELANKCLSRGDRRGEVYKLLAMSEYLLQQYDKFEAHIRQAIKLNPQDADAHYHLGRYFFEEKRYKDAMGSFQDSLKIQPAHYKARYYTGLVHERENEGESAKQEFQAAIQTIESLKVRYAWPFTDLGKWLINEGDYDRGVGWLYRATRNDPKSPHAWYHYAKALLQKDPSYEVKEALLVAIRLDAGYSEAYYLLARYYQKTGEERLSKEAFAKFDELKKNPIPSPFGLRR